MISLKYNFVLHGQPLSVMKYILFKWKGSLYKLIYVDLIFYLGFYYFINFIYRFALNNYQRKVFVKMVQFADEMKEHIPFFFILGFFVAGVLARWIRMFLLIPWLNRQAFIFEGSFNGNDSIKSRRLRRTLLRYLNLAWIIQMCQISDQIAIRFHNTKKNKLTKIGMLPIHKFLIHFNEDTMIQQTYGKIITDAEIKTFEAIAIENEYNNQSKYVPEFWIPIQWASRIIQKSFVHKYLGDVNTKYDMIKELENVRRNMQELRIFTEITIPLVYTQVVIIAVYSFFLCELLAAQLIDPGAKVKGHEVDTYFPFFTICEFLFLMGWLKVAMCLMNPFGDDDEDFQTSNILDYNLDSTYRSVSGESDMFPEKLDAPKMIYEMKIELKESAKDTIDNLEQFLDEIDTNLNDASGYSEPIQLKCLEMKKSFSQRFKKFFEFNTNSTKAVENDEDRDSNYALDSPGDQELKSSIF